MTTEKQRAQGRARNRAMRLRRIAANVCTKCGVMPPTATSEVCAACRGDATDRRRKRRRRKAGLG